MILKDRIRTKNGVKRIKKFEGLPIRATFAIKKNGKILKSAMPRGGK